MLGFLGKIGKGLATVAGISIGGGAAVAHEALLPVLSLDPSVVAGLQLVLEILGVFGGLLAMFGIGRKAGYAVPDVEK